MLSLERKQNRSSSSRNTEISITAIKQDSSPAPSTVKQWLSALRHRAGLILACTIVAAITAGGVSSLQEKQYTASATLLFRDPALANDLFGGSAFSPSVDPNRQAATNILLVELGAVSDLTAKALGRTTDEKAKELTSEDVSAMVSAAAAGDSDLVQVDATTTDPELSALVANTFTRQFIAFRAKADRSKLKVAKRLAEREYNRLSPAQQLGPSGESLSKTAKRLGVIASLQTGNAEFVQPAATPTSPSSPKPLRNGLLGALLGMVFGFGVRLRIGVGPGANEPAAEDDTRGLRSLRYADSRYRP